MVTYIQVELTYFYHFGWQFRAPAWSRCSAPMATVLLSIRFAPAGGQHHPYLRPGFRWLCPNLEGVGVVLPATAEVGGMDSHGAEFWLNIQNLLRLKVTSATQPRPQLPFLGCSVDAFIMCITGLSHIEISIVVKYLQHELCLLNLF